MKIDLGLQMFAKNANRPQSKELFETDLLEINIMQTRGRNESFKKFGKKVNVVECLLTNENHIFTVYYFCEVYEHIKHLKNIKFVRNLKAISTQTDRLECWLECAKETKRKLKYDIDLCTDKLIIL